MKKLLIFLLFFSLFTCKVHGDLLSRVAHWRLDETSGVTLKDTLSTNHGTWVGSDIAVNGAFGADSDWTKDGGWTIADGVATCDGTDDIDITSTAAIFVVGKVYDVTFDITARNSGTLSVRSDAMSDIYTFTAAGTDQSATITAAGTKLVFRSSVSFDGSIDNVVVKEQVDSQTAPHKLGLLFDGANDALTVSANSLINARGHTALSISAWIKPASDGENDLGRIVDKTDNVAGTVGYEVNVRDEAGGYVRPYFSLQHATTDMAAKSNLVSIPIDQWSHIVCTYNEDKDSKGKIYVNNALQPLVTDTAGVGAISDDSSTDLTIGNHSGLARAFDGSISNVVFFTEAINKFDVEYLYNGGKGTHRWGEKVGTTATEKTTMSGNLN